MGNYIWKKQKEITCDCTNEPQMTSAIKYFFEISRIQTSIKHIDMSDKLKNLKHFDNSIINNLLGLLEYYTKLSYSHLFLKYNILKDNPNITVLTTIKTINEYGMCLEGTWPNDKNDDIPSEICYAEATKLHKCVTYVELQQDLEQMKQCLIEGHPFTIILKIFDSINFGKFVKTGEYLGKLMVTITGFDDSKKHFIYKYQNEVGVIPYDYIINTEYSSSPLFISDITNIRDEISEAVYCNDTPFDEHTESSFDNDDDIEI